MQRGECFGYLVPDRKAQQALAALGFDPTACQHRSGKRFGGAHVSVLQRRPYVKDECRRQLAAAAAVLQGWVPPRLEIDCCSRNEKNDRVVFRCPMLAAASKAGRAAGWPGASPEVNMDDWHVYFYLGGAGADAKKAAALRDCLQQAQWGWVLSVSTAAADKTFAFDWDSFIPIVTAGTVTVANVAFCRRFGAGVARLHAVSTASALDGSGTRRDVATWRGAPGPEHDGADRWQFQPAGDGSVRIVNVTLGEPLYAVDASGGDPKRRDVRCWAGSSSTDHDRKDRWIVAPQPDGTYTITNLRFEEALYTVNSGQ